MNPQGASREGEGIGYARRPPFTGAFHDYVISMSLQQAARWRALRAGQARRLHRSGRRRISSEAEQRWENEGGSLV
jgi:hypothetical protein